MSQLPPELPTRKRSSCFGCIVQCTIVLLLGGCGALLLSAFITPWGFFLGGKFHMIPYWDGYATLHSPIAGDYAVFLNMYPAITRQGPYLKGNGYVCTRKETFYLRLYGSVPRNASSNLNGAPIHINLYRYSNFSGDRRPEIEFVGNWRNPEIVANDNGSISRAFEPDGSVFQGTNRPWKRETVPVTFKEGSKSDFDAACAKIQHR